MVKNRKQYEIMETHYMKAKYYHQDKCFYCGVQPDAQIMFHHCLGRIVLGYQVMVDKH
jgi:hypothetical protein